jgi:nucleoside phosphorylase
MRSELAPIVKAMGLESAEVGGSKAKVGRVGGVDVVATLTGMGMGPAREATERLLDATPVDHVMVVGIAGGIHPEIAVGDLVFPDVVVDGSTQTEYRPDHLGSPEISGMIVSSDDFTIEPAAVQRLVDRGVVAVDMETGAVAAACVERGCRWSVIRSISDMATDHPDDAVLGLAKPDGSPDAKAAAKFLLTHPGRIPKLVRLAKGARLAATNAANAATRACATA